LAKQQDSDIATQRVEFAEYLKKGAIQKAAIPETEKASLIKKIENETKAKANQPLIPLTQNQPKIQTTAITPIKVKTKEWGPEFSSLENLFGQATQDRKELNDLRQRNIERYFAIRDTQNPNFVNLARDTTEETIAYIIKRITQTIIELGPPPTYFCIFIMGSMARQESGFYTDLEAGVLVKEKNVNVIKYFQKFAQKLSDRFFLLGEHPDVGGKGLRMDEADNSPAHLKFFARYACEEQAKSLLKSALEKRDFDKIPFEGSRIFIATPEEFAQHVNPDFLTEQEKVPIEIEEDIFKEEMEKALKDPANEGRKETEVAKEIKSYVNTLLKPLNPREKQISGSVESLIRNVRFLYGDKNLFDAYLKAREIYLSGPPKNANPFYNNRREEIAFLEMKKDLIKYMNKPESSIVTGKLGKEVDIKRELYRFPEQILTNLGFWYNLGEQNTTKIAQLLAQKGLMNHELSKQLVDLMNYLIGLRFKKQEVCRKQTHALPTTLEEYNEQKEELESDLKKFKKQRDFMVQSNSPAADFEKVDKDISKIQNSLIELKKIKPLEETSILSAEEINTLNTKYLPILKKVFETAKAFILGNKNAFLEYNAPENITTISAIAAPSHVSSAAQEKTTAILASPQLSYVDKINAVINELPNKLGATQTKTALGLARLQAQKPNASMLDVLKQIKAARDFAMTPPYNNQNFSTRSYGTITLEKFAQTAIQSLIDDLENKNIVSAGTP
jgi:hypothetical protein